MRKAAFQKQLQVSTAASSEDPASTLSHLQDELHTAVQRVQRLTHQKAVLKAALAEARAQHQALASELRRFTLEPASPGVERRRLGDAAIVYASKAFLTQASACDRTQRRLERHVGCSKQLAAALESTGWVQAVVALLAFAQTLLPQTPTCRFTQLAEEVTASIERSKELLSTPKKATEEAMRKIRSVDTLAVLEKPPAAKTKTRVSIRLTHV